MSAVTAATDTSAPRQAEGLLGEERAQHLGGARRDGDRARVEVGFVPVAQGARIAAELAVGTAERHRQLARALLDLAPEELLQRRLRRRLRSVMEPGKKP